jgi:CHASE2 domain-containing sensor protein
VERFGWSVTAWVLMTNHFHLVIRTPQPMDYASDVGPDPPPAAGQETLTVRPSMKVRDAQMPEPEPRSAAIRKNRVLDFSAVREASLRHWLVILALILAGAALGERPWLMHVRHQFYRLLQTTLRTTDYPDVVTVVIDDTDYYNPPLNRTSPLNRAYLGNLIECVQRGNPEVIALDVALRALAPDGSIADPSPDQTLRFLRRIGKVAESTPVVLPRAMRVDEGRESYVLEANLFDGFDFGTKAKVLSGYILLPLDIREVPPAVADNRSRSIESFAGAVVRAKTRRRFRVAGDSLFAFFRPDADFDPHTARRVLAAPDADLAEWFAHRVVLIGGAWHADAFNTGVPVDAHLTPMGVTAGLFVHANYIQTLLSAPMKGLSAWWRLAIESLFALVIAIVFLAARGRWTFYLIATVLLTFLAVNYFFWQVLGSFFEAVVPLTLLGAHAAIEQVAEWKRLASSASPSGG